MLASIKKLMDLSDYFHYFHSYFLLFFNREPVSIRAAAAQMFNSQQYYEAFIMYRVLTERSPSDINVRLSNVLVI
jgi:hypothetical protein